MIRIEEIKERFKSIANNHDIILYGSVVNNNKRPNSDIDIAVISYLKNKEELKKLQFNLFSLASRKYDIRVFELLPIYIQISIIQNYKVIFGNLLEISEYFYIYRKKWDDCKYRILSNQFKNYQERLTLMK
ncbi:MAG: nucleotidyltransferase domain-containing protein [Candidatus Lokiarchaeota archaeon]|nr:nucleotidyltransferase domain-containing protein [Candidatus Lokiarchaeota archaeon]